MRSCVSRCSPTCATRPMCTATATSALVQRAADGIAALNARHAAAHDGADRFFLLHRERRWNEREGCWMGHERKRGKLADLNALLRGDAGVGPDQAFALAVGRWQQLSTVRYVITLDSDTELPQGSAAADGRGDGAPAAAPALRQRRARRRGDRRTRSAAAAQPGQPAGHAALAPGAAARRAMPASTRTRTRCPTCTRTCSAKARSSARASTTSTPSSARWRGRLPDGRILSHDLIEGCHARSGLLSDVDAVRAGRRTRYAAEAARRAPLDARRLAAAAVAVRPRCACCRGTPRNPLSALSRLKLFDNLRRSLVPPALLAVLLLGWTVLAAGGAWTLAVVAVLGGCRCSRRPRPGCAAAPTTRSTRLSWRVPALRLLHQLALLPDEARLMLDAIVRTLWRLGVSRRRLLRMDRVGADCPPARRRAARRLRARRCASCRPARCSRWSALGAAGRRARTGLAVGGAPLLVLWALAPLLRVVARPAAAPARAAAVGRRPAAGAQRGAAHLGVFRDLRRRGRPPPAAGQRAARAGGARRPPHLADQHRPGAARTAGRARPGLPAAAAAAGAARCAAGHAGEAGAAPRPLLQLVRHAHAASRWRRATSAPWTAATWPRRCWCCAPACSGWSTSRSSTRAGARAFATRWRCSRPATARRWRSARRRSSPTRSSVCARRRRPASVEIHAALEMLHRGAAEIVAVVASDGARGVDAVRRTAGAGRRR